MGQVLAGYLSLTSTDTADLAGAAAAARALDGLALNEQEAGTATPPAWVARRLARRAPAASTTCWCAGPPTCSPSSSATSSTSSSATP